MVLRKGGIQPFKRGFFCNDQSIMKPFIEESTSLAGTLSAGVVIALVVVRISCKDLFSILSIK